MDAKRNLNEKTKQRWQVEQAVQTAATAAAGGHAVVGLIHRSSKNQENRM